MPRVEKRLPRHVLSADEAERILNVPDVTSSLGIRDRAMLETFHRTGMRRAELVSLHVHDVDHERGTVMIREGKGKRDRLIPIGERVLARLERREEAERIEQTQPNRLRKRVYGQKEV